LGLSDIDIARRLEPFFHFVPITWALFGANYALVNKTINPHMYGTCWIAPLPFGCDTNDLVGCERGENAERVRWIVHGFVGIIIFIFIIILMTVMFLHIRGQELRNMAQRLRNTIMARGTSSRNENDNDNFRENFRASNNPSTLNTSTGFLRQSVTNSQRVLNQAIAYVTAYLLAYGCMYINSGTKRFDGPIPIAVSILFPLQGLFNFWVFIFPRFTRQLRANYEYNMCQGMHAAIMSLPITRPTRNRSNRNQANITSTFGPQEAFTAIQNTVLDIPTLTTPNTAFSVEFPCHSTADTVFSHTSYQNNAEDIAITEKDNERVVLPKDMTYSEMDGQNQSGGNLLPRRVSSITFDPSSSPNDNILNYVPRQRQYHSYTLASIRESTFEEKDSERGSSRTLDNENSAERCGSHTDSELRSSLGNVESLGEHDGGINTIGDHVSATSEEELEYFPG